MGGQQTGFSSSQAVGSQAAGAVWLTFNRTPHRSAEQPHKEIRQAGLGGRSHWLITDDPHQLLNDWGQPNALHDSRVPNWVLAMTISVLPILTILGRARYWSLRKWCSAASALVSLLASSRSIKVMRTLLHSNFLIFPAGYRSDALYKRPFISGGCTVVVAPRHRALFHRYSIRNCKGGWSNGGSGLEVLDCSAAYDVPVVYRFVNIKGILPERHAPFCCVAGSQISKKYSPALIV